LARLPSVLLDVVDSREHVLPEYSEHAYFLAVETAFKKWEAMQNIGR
jgi:hypothetical protein